MVSNGYKPNRLEYTESLNLLALKGTCQVSMWLLMYIEVKVIIGCGIY